MKPRLHNQPITYSLFPEVELTTPARNLAVSPDRVSTNTTTYQHPVHRWFNFIAGFSPEFVHQCCDQASLQAGDLLLDPFAGCATAPLVACQRGMRAIGFEPHPVFARIGRAKLPTSRALQQLALIEGAILEGIAPPSWTGLLSAPSRLFLTKLFPLNTLEQLLGAREALKQQRLLESDLAFLMLSRIVDWCSHSKTDGIYKAPTSLKRSISPFEACRAITDVIRTDLVAMNGLSYGRLGRIYRRSAEDVSPLPDASVGIVITSPPYLNNFDYAEMTRMYLYFWQIADSWADITNKVRGKLIVNTTTALKGHKNNQQAYRSMIASSLHPYLDPLFEELAIRRQSKSGKKEYDYLVYPYFAQMTRALRECFRCMRRGSPIHIMVADAALYGVHISTPQLLTHILSTLGFRNAACTLVRRRGHRWMLAKREGSEAGLGEYHIQAVR